MNALIRWMAYTMVGEQWSEVLIIHVFGYSLHDCPLWLKLLTLACMVAAARLLLNDGFQWKAGRIGPWERGE